VNSRRIPVAVVAIALAGAATLIGVSAVRGERPAPDKQLAAGVQHGVFTGIPQHGIVLGSARAPVTLVEVADLQCPYCAEFARFGLPPLVQDYVRTGRVKVVFEGLAFLGPDSTVALRMVLAAGLQDRAWDVIDGLYGRQGAENSGWVTMPLLHEAGAAVRGLDVDRMVRQSRGLSVTRLVRAAERFARRGHVDGTPAFFVGRSGGPLRRIEIRSLTAEALRPALDAALSG
jgi:protein-disulfide isomerase